MGKGKSKHYKEWLALRKIVFARDHYKCRECGSTYNLTMDHVHPLILGGSNYLQNLQCLCFYCNTNKGSSYDKKKCKELQTQLAIETKAYLDTLSAVESSLYYIQLKVIE